MNQSDRTTEPRTLLGEQILKSAREREERLRRLWEMGVDERVEAMRRGELSLEQCAAWAARYPEQVPLLNGEFEYLAAFTPEARE
jgi:hypothetical protein